MKRRCNGKDILVCYLMDKEGYSYLKAVKLVNVVVDVIKKQLIAGNNVEIEGLGVLTLVERRQNRVIRKTLKHVGPTIVPYSRNKKTVMLKDTIKWRLTDE